MNFLEGTVGGDGRTVEGSDFRPADGGEVGDALAGRKGERIVVGVRPEHLAPARTGDGEGMPGTVERIEPLGSQVMIQLRVGDGLVVAQFAQDPALKIGQNLASVIGPTPSTPSTPTANARRSPPKLSRLPTQGWSP